MHGVGRVKGYIVFLQVGYYCNEQNLDTLGR